MGLPAARVGDFAGHGGMIMPPGAPTVFIGGMPAARMGDMIVCPGFDGPKPHIMGNIVMGSTSVIIYGAFAARQTDPTGCGIAGMSGMSMPAIAGPADPGSFSFSSEDSDWSFGGEALGGKAIIKGGNYKVSGKYGKNAQGLTVEASAIDIEVESKETVFGKTAVQIKFASTQAGADYFMGKDGSKTGIGGGIGAQANLFEIQETRTQPDIPLSDVMSLLSVFTHITPAVNDDTLRIETVTGYSVGVGAQAAGGVYYDAEEDRTHMMGLFDSKLLLNLKLGFNISVGKKKAAPSTSTPGVGIPLTPGMILMGCPTVFIG
jgi:uncharacterized Zn-binding protein involved in type VI secretion